MGLPPGVMNLKKKEISRLHQRGRFSHARDSPRNRSSVSIVIILTGQVVTVDVGGGRIRVHVTTTQLGFVSQGGDGGGHLEGVVFGV